MMVVVRMNNINFKWAQLRYLFKLLILLHLIFYKLKKVRINLFSPPLSTRKCCES